MDDRQELLLTMLRGSSSDARDRCLRIGAETLPEEALVALLREETDDVARNAGLEMLKLRGRRSFATAVQLLGDDDDDVVLQGVLLLDAIGDPRAWPRLRPLLRRSNENIVQAAITAAGRLGSRATVSDILPFLEGDLWMRMAALAALGQLRSRAAVGAVARLLADPDLGGAAAEALARIGGASATRALVDRWMSDENAEWLPLIAQSLADADAPPQDPALRSRIARYLASDVP